MKSTKKIILYGCTPQPIKIISRMKSAGSKIELIGFLDSDNEKWNKKYEGFNVFGGVEKIKSLYKDVYFCNCITRDTLQRMVITNKILRQGGKLINLIDPGIDTEFVKLGQGLLIQEGTTLQYGVEIEDNVSIHMASLISHNVKIGNSSIITFGCNIGGSVEIGQGSRIFTNATIAPNVKIGNWSVVGANSLVLKDVPDYCLVYGNPARIIKRLDKNNFKGWSNL